MKELIVATTNQGKVKEIQAMLKDLNIEVKSLKDVYDDVPDIVEDGKTFKENALIKAKYVADDLHKIVLADDSGIEIDAFGKASRNLFCSLFRKRYPLSNYQSSNH